jgi:hypothetical protein
MVKSKVVPLPPCRRQAEERYHSFLTSALDGGEWLASRPGRALDCLKWIQLTYENNIYVTKYRVLSRYLETGITAECLVLLVRELPCSNVGPGGGRSWSILDEVLRDFPQYVQANSGIVPSIRLWPLPQSFRIIYSVSYCWQRREMNHVGL